MRLFQMAIIGLALLFLLSSSFAHGGVDDGHLDAPVEEAFPWPDPAPYAGYAFGVILFLAIFSWFFRDIMTEGSKKAVFVLIAVIVGGLTIYMASYTVFFNITSESGGPVHWHADYEIWVCGEKATNLIESEGLENKVGNAVFHHHNDYRIHVEGVLYRLSDARLGKFFEVIGGALTKDTLIVPLNDGHFITTRNGDLCPDGKAGKVQLFVNNRSNDEIDDYILAPQFHTQIDGGEGDILDIVFGPEGENPGEGN